MAVRVRGSRPVRVGNAAAAQVQLDVRGELLDTMHQARRVGLPPAEDLWDLQRAIVEHVESAWREPDDGIWEVRSGSRPFTHSKVMAWVAMDRTVRSAEEFALEGPLDRWRAVRAAIHEDVCREATTPAVTRSSRRTARASSTPLFAGAARRALRR